MTDGKKPNKTVEIDFSDSTVNVDYRRVFEHYIEIKLPSTGTGDVKVVCPFHKDTDPSLSLNMKTGQWYCFGCHEKGDVFTFIQKMDDVDFKRAQTIAQGLSQPFISMKAVSDWVLNLQKRKFTVDFLKQKRGLTAATIKHFYLGFDGERITVPIFNNSGVVNIRRYKPGDVNKYTNYRTGYGSPPRLFPLDAFNKTEVWIVEGEMDCMVARQNGINAVTTTGGSMAWCYSWNSWFIGKDVVICYDTDDAGKKGAERIASQLQGFASNVRILNLPLKKSKSKDITDFFVLEKGDLKKLQYILKKVKPFTAISVEEISKGEEALELHLSSTSDAKNTFKRIHTKAIVAGKMLFPYTIPKTVLFTCNMQDTDLCKSCSIAGRKVIKITSNSKWILDLVNVRDTFQYQTLSSFAGVKCKELSMKITEFQNVEELTVIPDLDLTTRTQPYCVRKAYFVGHNIASNQAYIFDGLSLPHPLDQTATLLFDKAELVHGDLNIAITPKLKEKLEKFKIGKGSIQDKFDEIYNDLETNVTGIFGRRDLLMGVDLVFHSVLQFKFQDQLIERGGLDVLVMGDSRTGKSRTAQSLHRHYGLGEFITGENTSFAGLIGGVQQINKRWMITWGKIPINNGGMVIIDESSALSQEDFSRMSGIRSSGIAEVTKIQTEKTNANTRKIWLSNPRGKRTLGTYSYGVQALEELIGQPEDIARFDYAIAVANDEVSMKLINRKVIPPVPHIFTSDLCKLLLLWVWSRKIEDVVFTKKAVHEILRQSIALSQRYSATIPLIEGADQRTKLARIAVAIAGRLFSTTTCTDLVVEEEHVLFAVNFLEQIYRKASLGYEQFSFAERQDIELIEKNKDEITGYLKKKPELVHQLMRTHIFKSYRLAELLGLSPIEAEEIIAYLSKYGLLIPTSNGFVKNAGFVKILHEVVVEDTLERKPIKKHREKF